MNTSYHAMKNMNIEMIKDDPMCLYHIIHACETGYREQIEHTCALLSEHIYHKIIEYILHTPHRPYEDFDVCIRVPMRIYNCFQHSTKHKAYDTLILLGNHTNQRLYPHHIYINKFIHMIDPVCDNESMSCFFCGIPLCIQCIKTRLDLSSHIYFRISIKKMNHE